MQTLLIEILDIRNDQEINEELRRNGEKFKLKNEVYYKTIGKKGKNNLKGRIK